MLVDSTIELIGKFFKFVHFMGAIPYQWNPTTKAIRLTTSKWKLAHWYTVTIFTIFYASFMGFRLFHGICCLRITIEKIVYTTFIWICWSTVAAFNVNTWIFRRDVNLFINHFIGSNQNFKSKPDIFKHKSKILKISARGLLN